MWAAWTRIVSHHLMASTVLPWATVSHSAFLAMVMETASTSWMLVSTILSWGSWMCVVRIVRGPLLRGSRWAYPSLSSTSAAWPWTSPAPKWLSLLLTSVTRAATWQAMRYISTQHCSQSENKMPRSTSHSDHVHSRSLEILFLFFFSCFLFLFLLCICVYICTESFFTMTSVMSYCTEV